MAANSDDLHLITEGSFECKISGYKERKNSSSLRWLRVLSLVIFVVCLILVIHLCFLLGNFDETHGTKYDCVGLMHHEYLSGHVYLSKPSTGEKLSYFGQIGKNLTGKIMERKHVENGFKYSWENGVTLLLKQSEPNCTRIIWEISEVKKDIVVFPVDCFNLTGKHWYGGGELYNQSWPFESAKVDMTPFYPEDIITAYYHKAPAFGPVLGRYWVTSNGTAILVNQSSPLLVGVNSHADKDHNYTGLLCLTIDTGKYPENTPAVMDYVVCQGENVKDTHQAMVAKFFKKPLKGPNTIMMRYPVWSTWVKYHKGVNQSDVEQFLAQIVSHNFSCSQIEIDDMYSTKYGDYDFDPVKFPNAKELIDNIHKSGCRVTVWAHPFANLLSKAYDEGKANDYFVAGPDGITAGLVIWWNGIAAAVDFTNPSAKQWYLTRLRNFQKKYDIDSFKFDAGSVTYLPYGYHLNDSFAMPSNYCVSYATAASEINDMVEVRVGDNSQHLPVFVRFLDRDASWSGVMGLQSVIPTVLTFGILGYPFILPDMIGGNGDPDKELFIRWLQLNTFLPAMQFSHAPWDFDNETIAIAHNMLEIREAIFPTLLEGVSNVVKTGEPIIRPLWWIAPEDPTALVISQQFMVMDVYLVAPVTEPGATNITVYLPKGKWMEQFGNNTVQIMNEGALRIYQVTLSDVIYFKNVTTLDTDTY